MSTATGLEGVVVAETLLSAVEGEAGRLIVRGHSIEELTGNLSFEDMLRLLWADLVPLPAAAPAGRRASLDEVLGRARVAVFDGSAGAASVPRLAALVAPAGPAAPAAQDGGLPPVAALRLGLAALRPAALGAEQDAILATAALPVLVAAFARARRGLAPVAPDPALGQAADLLAMLRGAPAPAAEVAALDAYLVTVAEHGMNASTFTARVVASTAAGVLPSVVAALGALEGPLHGGAPGPVLDMLDALADHPDRRAWLRAEIAAGRRLMGFGHRIYRVRDPRADVLKAQVERLRSGSATAASARTSTGTLAAPGTATGRAGDRLALAEIVERDALAVLAERHPERRLDTNVEFATAVLLDALDIDRDLFTSLFAAGRVAGWCAHIYEQQRSRRLIRPQSAYIGPHPTAAASTAPPA